MNDFRGNRISVFKVDDSQSGFVSVKQPDLLTSTHGAFRPIDAQHGPDGALYFADWYNPIIQHGEVDFRDERRDRQHGRIWRIAAKDRPLVEPPQIVEASVEQLLDRLKSTESWTRSQAKLYLKQKGEDAVIPALQNWIRDLDTSDPDWNHHRLEALWVMQFLRSVDNALVSSLLESDGFQARAATIRVLEENPKQNERAYEFFEKGIADPYPCVRLETLHALRALGGPHAAKVAMGAFSTSMDETMEFALWRTMTVLGDDWLPAATEDPLFFGADPKALIYAVRSLDRADGIAPLVSLWRSGDLKDPDAVDALVLIGELGQSEILGDVLRAVAERERNGHGGSPRILGALGNAATQRKQVPKVSAEDVALLLRSESNQTQIQMATLAGDSNADELASQAAVEGIGSNEGYCGERGIEPTWKQGVSTVDSLPSPRWLCPIRP